MTLTQVSRFLLFWGAAGVFAFSVFVVVAFRTGLVYTARKDDGTLKKRIPVKGLLAMMIIPLSLLGLHLLSNYFGLVRRGITLAFWTLFLLNYGIYVIFFAYDTLVIDGLILAFWRPPFLKLPDSMGRESMGRHILVSIPIGLIIGALLTLVSTIIAYTIWMA